MGTRLPECLAILLEGLGVHRDAAHYFELDGARSWLVRVPHWMRIDRAAFDAIAPVLANFGRGVTYVGEGEVARLVKIAHNVMLGVVTQSLAEITVLAEKGGVTREAFLNFLNDSVMGSVFTQYKSPAFANLDFAATFTMPLLQKDFDLGLDAAKKMGVSMPIAQATRDIVADEVNLGNVEDDFATLLVRVAKDSDLVLTSENSSISNGLEPQK
jgi:hypothetical protein